MARTKRANRYCVDCGSRLVYYPRLSNPKAPNEYRVLVYACPDCSNDFDRPKMFSIKRNQVENPLETCLLYTSPSPRDLSTSRMPSSA